MVWLNPEKKTDESGEKLKEVALMNAVNCFDNARKSLPCTLSSSTSERSTCFQSAVND